MPKEKCEVHYSFFFFKINTAINLKLFFITFYDSHSQVLVTHVFAACTLIIIIGLFNCSFAIKRVCHFDWNMKGSNCNSIYNEKC